MHIREIMKEEHLVEDCDFSYQPASENKHRPDFLFPSEALYHDASYPSSKLRMLAVKSTLRDRWRQILEEADRVAHKHLLTLDEGVSEKQYRDIHASGISLVVPKSLHGRYPKPVQPELQTLESFLGDVRMLRQ